MFSFILTKAVTFDMFLSGSGGGGAARGRLPRKGPACARRYHPAGDVQIGRLPDQSLRGSVTAARRPVPRPRRRQARMQAVAAEGETKLVLIGLGVVEMPRELFALLDAC